MKKWIALLLCLAMTLTLFAGCGEKVATNEDGEPLIPLKTSGQDVVQTGLPIIAGEQLGIWEELGLDVSRLHYSGGPPQLEAAPAGDWSIGWTGATAANNGILKYDMVVLGLSGYDNSNVAVARSDSPLAQAGIQGIEGAKTTYGTAEDWKGLDIICPIGTVDYCDLTTLLSHLGLTEEDVNIINMDTTNMRQAFLAGEGDVMFVSSYLAAEFADKEGYTIVHTMEGMDAAMSGVIIAPREFLTAENEDTIVKYLEGAIEVLVWAGKEENQQAGAQAFLQGMKDEFGVELSEEGALQCMKWIEWPSLEDLEELCKVGEDGLTGLQREYQKFYQAHVDIGLQSAADLDKILAGCDSSYLEKAIANYKEHNGIE